MKRTLAPYQYNFIRLLMVTVLIILFIIGRRNHNEATRSSGCDGGTCLVTIIVDLYFMAIWAVNFIATFVVWLVRNAKRPRYTFVYVLIAISFLLSGLAYFSLYNDREAWIKPSSHWPGLVYPVLLLILCILDDTRFTTEKFVPYHDEDLG